MCTKRLLRSCDENVGLSLRKFEFLKKFTILCGGEVMGKVTVESLVGLFQVLW